MKYEPETDLKELEAMVSNLKTYLQGKELYGMLSPNLPRMTVGGLLLRLKRLQAYASHLAPAQKQRLEQFTREFEGLRSAWRVHYEEKVVQEIGARLRNMRAFLDEQKEPAKTTHEVHPVEAANRTIIEYLRSEATDLKLWKTEFTTDLARVDQRLRPILGSSDGKFIWNEALQPSYPQDKFWWLYGG